MYLLYYYSEFITYTYIIDRIIHRLILEGIDSRV
jgi:hypothetical protein